PYPLPSMRLPFAMVTAESKRPSNVASMWIGREWYIASWNLLKEASLTRSKSGAGLIWLGKTTTMLIQEGHGFSVKASIHISFPAIVPRTLIIFPAYWSGCWYNSQSVVSTGRLLAWARLKAQQLKMRIEMHAQVRISFILVAPVAAAVGLVDVSRFE